MPTSPRFARLLTGGRRQAADERGVAGHAGVPGAMPWLAVAILFAWVASATVPATSQWGDHFEQFVWAHGVQWGYHKHPPLPTWILAAAIGAFGPWPLWPPVLAALCGAGTAAFTFAIGKRLLPPAVATLGLLLWGLQQPFSNRANLYNHNTVLMVTVAATAWCVLRALDSPRRGTAWWLAAGLGGGLSLLAKYQALVPLAGLVLALLLSGQARLPATRRGLLLATVVMLAVIAPHVAWLVDVRFTAVDWAVQKGRSLDAAARLRNVASFLVQQVRLVIPALLFAGVLAVMPRPAAAGRVDEAQSVDQRRRAWLIGLVLFPLLATVFTGPLFGIALQNHWGYQALQFAGLWLAWRLRHRAGPARVGWIVIALVVHAVFMTVQALPLGKVRGARVDSRFPAQRLADAVRRDWITSTPCPLAIVVGPPFEAGMVSVYNGGTAVVLEGGDFRRSPWISPADLSAKGAVWVDHDAATLPRQGVARTGSLDVGDVAAPGQDRIYWAVVPPPTCPAAPTPAR